MFIACAKKPPIVVSMPTELQHINNHIPDQNETIISLEPPSWTIYFDFNSSVMKETRKIISIGDYMLKNGGQAYVYGYASEEGEEGYNLALGSRRAQAVRDYLMAYGIAETCVTWKSYGESNPVSMEPEKIYLNRRVEIKIEGVE
jgi:peptidoglycan-associated lipoprotein